MEKTGEGLYALSFEMKKNFTPSEITGKSPK